MPDQFTEVTTTGYGSRIVSSIQGVVAGFILLMAAFGLLYWNEGRIDLSKIAKNATEINSAAVSVDTTLAGKLVSATGIVNSDGIIGDNLFLKPDKFMLVERRVEMYSWTEKKETYSKTNIGGSTTNETTYTYFMKWDENPGDSSKFKDQTEHQNPQKGLENVTNKVNTATIGAYGFNPQSAALPDAVRLSLNSQNIILSGGAIMANDSYIFIRRSEGGTFENPKIGDLRVSFNVLRPAFNGTIFGKLNGNSIDPYFDQNGNELYRVFTGTRDQGIAAFHNEYTTLTWILRLVGFLLMWFGLSSLFGPISVLLDILPIFGAVSRALIGAVTFVVALIFTIVTIIVSMIAHNFVALVISIVIVIAAIIAFAVFLKKKRIVATNIPSSPASI